MQRFAVLRAVAGHPHGSAETIAHAVRADLGMVSRQAEHGALRGLTGKEAPRRLQPAGSPALFDPRVGDVPHHAICRTCGGIAGVDGTPWPPSGSDPGDGHGDLIDEVEIWYRGVCSACRSAAGESAAP